MAKATQGGTDDSLLSLVASVFPIICVPLRIVPVNPHPMYYGAVWRSTHQVKWSLP